MPDPRTDEELTERINQLETSIAQDVGRAHGREPVVYVTAALLGVSSKMAHFKGYTEAEFVELAKLYYRSAACEFGDCRNPECPKHRSRMS